MRIISLAPSITESLLAMGLGDRVVAISSWCKLLRFQGYGEVDTKPVAGDYTSIRWDRVHGLNPDLALLSGGYPAKSLSGALPVPVFVIMLPHSVYEIPSMLLEIGAVVNERERAVSVAQRFAEELSELEGLGRGVSIYVELDLGVATAPGFFSHVSTGLAHLGFNVLNMLIDRDYVWGDDISSIRRRLAGKADLVVLEAKSRIITPELSSRYARLLRVDESRLVLLPVLTLSSYGPSYPRLLRSAAEAILKRL